MADHKLRPESGLFMHAQQRFIAWLAFGERTGCVILGHEVGLSLTVTKSNFFGRPRSHFDSLLSQTGITSVGIHPLFDRLAGVRLMAFLACSSTGSPATWN